MMSAIISPLVSRSPDPETPDSMSELGSEGETKEGFAEVLAPQTQQATPEQRHGETQPTGDPLTRPMPAVDRPEMAVVSLNLRSAAASRLPAIPAAAESLHHGQRLMANDAGSSRKLTPQSTRSPISKTHVGAGGVLGRPGAGEAAGLNTDGITAMRVGAAGGSLSQTALPSLNLNAAVSALSPGLTPSLLTTPVATTLQGGATNAGPGQNGIHSAMTFAVSQPVGAEGWSQQLGDKILTVMRADVGEAVINLAPEELGPVKVSLTVVDGEVRLHWIAHASETRQALEQSIPRLREMFAQEGLQLADSQVSSGGPQDSSGNRASESDGDRGAELGRTERTESSAENSRLVAVTESRHAGLLDLYA